MPPPSARLWTDRLARLFVAAGAPLASALTGVIRNKWIALHLDASGVGVLAQVISGQTWIGALSGLGLGLPVARALGEATGRGDDAAARRVVWTAISLVSAAAGISAVAGLLFADALSTALLGSPEHAGVVRISMIGVAGVAFQVTVQGVFAGRSDTAGPLAFAIAGGGTAMLLAFVLVPRWGIAGAAWAAVLLYPAGFLGAAIARRQVHAPALLPIPRPALDRRQARALLRIGGATLGLSLFDLGSLLGLRAHYLRAHGVDANGLLQAALALSQQVGAIFYAYLGAYAFGKVTVAAATGGAQSVERYTRRHWIPLVGLAVLAIGFAMVAAAPLLRLLYSSRFDPARPMMALALFGEFCRVGAQIWGLGSLPVGGTRAWLTIGAVQPLALLAAYPIAAACGAGPLSLPCGYAISGASSLVAALIAMSRLGVRPRPRDLGVLLAALAALSGLMAVLLR